MTLKMKIKQRKMNKIIVIDGLSGTIKKITENYVILSITGACNFEEYSSEVKIMRRDNSMEASNIVL